MQHGVFCTLYTFARRNIVKFSMNRYNKRVTVNYVVVHAMRSIFIATIRHDVEIEMT